MCTNWKATNPHWGAMAKRQGQRRTRRAWCFSIFVQWSQFVWLSLGLISPSVPGLTIAKLCRILSEVLPSYSWSLSSPEVTHLYSELWGPEAWTSLLTKALPNPALWQDSVSHPMYGSGTWGLSLEQKPYLPLAGASVFNDQWPFHLDDCFLQQKNMNLISLRR